MIGFQFLWKQPYHMAYDSWCQTCVERKVNESKVSFNSSSIVLLPAQPLNVFHITWPGQNTVRSTFWRSFQRVRCIVGSNTAIRSVGRVEHPNQLAPNWKAREGRSESSRWLENWLRDTALTRVQPVAVTLALLNRVKPDTFTLSYPGRSSVTHLAI